MFAHLPAGSPATVALLIACLVLALAFEFSNGFHDTANAVATVIYTHSLKPAQAVAWSGIWNFIGVIAGGIAVAYALVEILPPEVLSPPDGGTASGMLIGLFVTALGWNLLTWSFGIPNSSSHALIGALVGIAIGSSIKHHHFGQGVEWKAIIDVLEGLLASPLLGFALSWALFRAAARLLHDQNLFTPPKNETPPVWWMRGLLVLTCTGVSFAHGTNDGQKSIGLIMLTVIGLMPASFALNHDASKADISRLRTGLPTAAALIDRYGDEQKQLGVQAEQALGQAIDGVNASDEIVGPRRISVRADIYRVLAELETISTKTHVPKSDASEAKSLHRDLSALVTYAPWWVRILSAVALGLGTMIGYKRIVTTLGERLGDQHLVPAQGAAAEIVAAGLIAGAGVTGFPVSTTHVVTAGIAGTMVGAKAGLQTSVIWQIVAAWILTLPVTIIVAVGLFQLLA